MKKISTLIIIAIIALGNFYLINAQPRIAVLPFKNLDGKLEYNEWCFNLQDSLAKSLKLKDLNESLYNRFWWFGCLKVY